MAERRYSPSDQAKMVRDGFADLRARGVDAQGGQIVHPAGVKAGLRELQREVGSLQDQAGEQGQIERQRLRESAERLRRGGEGQ
jgi:hypothetical protein